MNTRITQYLVLDDVRTAHWVGHGWGVHISHYTVHAAKGSIINVEYTYDGWDDSVPITDPKYEIEENLIIHWPLVSGFRFQGTTCDYGTLAKLIVRGAIRQIGE